jgi:hypothetical protein
MNQLILKVNELEVKVRGSSQPQPQPQLQSKSTSSEDLTVLKTDIKKYVDEQLSMLDKKISMINSQSIKPIDTSPSPEPPSVSDEVPVPVASNDDVSIERAIEEEMQQASATDGDFTFSTKKKGGRKPKK